MLIGYVAGYEGGTVACRIGATLRAGDAQRGAAFAALRERGGLGPADILAAPFEVLRGITRKGGAIAAEERMDRLRLAAKLGDLDAVLRLPFQKAKNALMRYPMIGEPGAEKILLFCGVLPVLAVESSGLRVLVRYGIGVEGKSAGGGDGAVAAGLWVAAEGQSTVAAAWAGLCLRKAPACRACPVRGACNFAIW